MTKPIWRKLLNLAIDDGKLPTLSCSDCYSLMDEYADMILDGIDPAAVMPLVKEHLGHCEQCEEILETLVAMVRVAEGV